MTWFEKLMGFEEISPENVRTHIEIEGEKLISKANGKSYRFGTLELPSLRDLQRKINLRDFKRKISLSETVGNVGRLHCAPENNGAVFQAASQFNLLEMVHPTVTPEKGVGIYENDATQGPACAIACGAGTVYRNYFVPLNGQVGQTEHHQINCLSLFEDFFNNEKFRLWSMRNGYCYPTAQGLERINAHITAMVEDEREILKGKLKVGIQWNAEVTTANKDQIVSQVYCSALPIGYVSGFPEQQWESFAKIILEATYEATFYAALINLENGGSNRLLLTLVGGGVFGNKTEWILDAIKKSVQKFRNTDLDVRIVSYGQSNVMVRKMIAAV
ncbi:hypothetical protein [Chryseobacterium sp. HSC-36S06]|uniref:hypothetical protein n=1 Tax=Chryseobacterium sp. HSC-36S06 TaxID=2910970 RepID=UPI0020A1094F|nr:hypothetical protein [Chryseobacterium sp. HSC-36S06]MCP2038929.1 hypothetical protein [Chryseobacterium sp. HSC-36S06]